MTTKYTETDYRAVLNARISNFENSMDELAVNVRATKQRIDHVKYLIKEPEREIQNVARVIRENPIAFFVVGSLFSLGLTYLSVRKSRRAFLDADEMQTTYLLDESDKELFPLDEDHVDDSYGI